MSEDTAGDGVAFDGSLSAWPGLGELPWCNLEGSLSVRGCPMNVVATTGGTGPNLVGGLWGALPSFDGRRVLGPMV